MMASNSTLSLPKLTCLVCMAGFLIGIGRAQTLPDSSAQRTQEATSESSPIQFSGSTQLYGQSSSRQGLNQFLPASFTRWTLNSILTVYGIPLSINGLLTSEQGSSVQNVNYFSVGLSREDLDQQIRRKISERIGRLQELKAQAEQEGMDALRDSLREHNPAGLQDIDRIGELDRLRELQTLKQSDLEQRMSELQSLGLAGATQKVLSLFPTLTVGTAFPVYTPLVLGGVPVTGVNVEFTPGIFYLAFTGGSMMDASLPFGTRLDTLTKTAFHRTLVAGRFGLGSKDETHLYFTALHASDDGGSLKRDSSTGFITPQSNYVFGSEGALMMLDDRLSFSGEVAVSVLTGDDEGPASTSSNIPSWLGKLTNPNATSSYDYAFSLEGAYALTGSGTKLSALVRRVGPGYTSLGVPYLRNDLLRYEGKVEQQLADHQVNLSAYYRRDEDDLASTKASQTVTSALGAQVGLSFRNLPYLRVSYAPLSQQTQAVAESLKIQNDVAMASLMTGYTFRTGGGLISSTNFSFVYQEGKTLSGIGAYVARNSMLTQMVGFEFPLSLTATAGYTQTQIETAATDLVSFDFSASYIFFGQWQNTLGVSLIRDAANRNGVYLNSSFPLWNIALLSIGVETSTFEDSANSANNFHEVIGRVSLSKSW